MQNAYDLIKQRFGHQFSDELMEFLAKESLVLPVIKGQKIIKKGVPFNYMILILSGTMKVMRTAPDGSEHVLFYLKSGDACSETFTLCDEEGSSEVDLVAEQEGVILLIPQKLMKTLMSNYSDWREFVLKKFGERIREFLHTLDSITFKNLDERLLKYLKDKARVLNSNVINITHQNIANDLATSRVVISRLLKMLERKGVLKLSRNKIELLDV